MHTKLGWRTLVLGVTSAGALLAPSDARAQNYQQPRQIGVNQFGMSGAVGLVPPTRLPTINPNRSPAFANNPYATPYSSTVSNPLVDTGAMSNPYSSSSGYNASTGAMNNPYGSSSGYNASTGAMNNPYGNSSGYNASYESPIGGYMSGYAGVMNSLSKGTIDEQQSFLVRQSVYREKLENQRRAFDNWRHYRDKMPTPEDDRQREVAVQMRRALSDPPAGEIYSGRAMNVLLDTLGTKLHNDAPGQYPPVALVANDVSAHLNFTGQENKGNPGLLRFVRTDDGRLPWPVVLAAPQYKAERDLFDRRLRTAYKEAEAGRVDPTNLERMNSAVHKLKQSLTGNIGHLTPKQFGEGRRFLSDLDDALTLLRQPNARDFFGNRIPKAGTVPELIRDMRSRGLRFAPATAGDEAAYMAVHRALVMYATKAQTVVVTDKTP